MGNKNRIAGMTLPQIVGFLREQKSKLPYGYKLPYMQWYEDNFISSSGVRDMHQIEEWMYRQLLAKAWVSKNAPYLPNDEETLRRLSGCRDKKTWNKYSKAVINMFEKTENNEELYHSRQIIDYTVQISKVVSNIKNASGDCKSLINKEEVAAIAKRPLSEVPAVATLSLSQLELELEPELKQELKQEQKSEEIENDSLSDFENPDNGQGEGMNLKAFKQEMTNIGIKRSMKITGYPDTWENLKLLSNAHGSQAVLNDFDSFLSEGDEYPKGALAAYNQVAADRLSSDSPLQASAKDPEVVSLVRELSYASGGLVCFLDKQRARLAEVLKEFTAEEIKSAFKTWVETQDLNDTKNLSYAPGKFVQIADNLAYSARKQKQEAEKAKTLRDATARRLQEEAEIDRQAREKMKQDESEIFDPLAELLSETDKAVV